MGTRFPVAVFGSVRGVSIRAQRAEIRKLERCAASRELLPDELNRLRFLRERDRLRNIKRSEKPRAKRQSAGEQIAEMIALEALQRERQLTHAESERLGELVMLEQKRARYRPARIKRLRAELELLETLEMAERGAVAEGCAQADPIELHCVGDGSWTASERRAA